MTADTCRQPRLRRRAADTRSPSGGRLRAPEGAGTSDQTTFCLSPDLFSSADAFADYVGRYREVGVDELVFYWPTDPETFERSPKHEQAFERIASETIPTLREAAGAT